MLTYEHKIPWFSKSHTVTETESDFINYWMYADYKELVESGQQQVSEDIHKLFDYLEQRVFKMDIYLDITLTEQAYKVPKKYFPHDLFEWERFLLPFFFGFRFKEDDSLVFDDFFLYMARGSGKNYFMAWVIFACITNINGIRHYDVGISASSERQAKASYMDIMDIIKNNPKLDKAFKATKQEMTSKTTDSNFMYLSSNGSTMDGMRLGLSYTDEVHAIGNYEALNVMRSSLGKIPDARSVITSTDGYTRGVILDDYKEDCSEILSGNRGVDFDIEDERHTRTFPFIHRIDDISEAKDIVGWQKANPSVLYNNQLLRRYRTEVAKIDSNAELNMEFHLKRLNYVKEDSRFAIATLSERRLTKVRGIDYYRDVLGQSYVMGCVDFSTSRDLTSVAIVGQYEDEYYYLHHSFITHEQRTNGQINPQILEKAEEQGKLTVVKGKIITEQDVVNWFLGRLKEGWVLSKIFIDQYKSGVLGTALDVAGFDVERIATNMLNETLVSPILDVLFTQNKLFVGNDDLFVWAVGNIYKQVTNKGVRFEKIEPKKRKTDPFSAFVAYLIGTVGEDSPPVNGGFGGLVI